MEVDHIGQHLHMALGLHKAAHDAEGAHGLSVLGEEAGDDGVVRLFAGSHTVFHGLVHGEVIAPVVEDDACARKDGSGAKAAVDGLYVADHVAVAVGCI